MEDLQGHDDRIILNPPRRLRGPKEVKVSRNEQDILECMDTESGEFDWDRYQELCDIAEYWECEE